MLRICTKTIANKPHIYILLQKQQHNTLVSHMLQWTIIHWQGVEESMFCPWHLDDCPKGITESSKELCIADKGRNKLVTAGECILIIIIIFKLKKNSACIYLALLV